VQPIFLVRVEEAGMPTAHELVLRYALEEAEGAIRVLPERHLQPTGRSFPAALAG
jgi:hypothetical protein